MPHTNPESTQAGQQETPQLAESASPWMTIKEVATFCRVSTRSVERALAGRALLHGRVGAAVRIHQDDVDAWLRGQQPSGSRRGPRRAA